MESRQKNVGPLSPPGVRTLRLTRPLSLCLLFLLYLLAYLLVPYWDVPREDWQKLGMAVFTGCLGLAWAWLGSEAMEIRFSRREAVWLLVALGLLGAINAMPLTSDLSWRGDEDHHFKASRMMVDYAGQCWLPCLLALIPLVVTLLWQRGPGGKVVWAKLLALQAVTAGLVVLAVVVIKPKMIISPATYPLVVPWMESIFLQLGRPFLGWIPAPEVFYRMVPLLSAAGMAWYCSRHVMNDSPGGGKGLSLVARGLFIVAVGTVPVLFYYSSILYLEMPVLLCMTVLCLGADDLLGAPVEELARKPLWIAVLLVGFLKDNVAPLLGVLVACRWLARAASVWKSPRRLQAALGEARFAYCAMAPYFTYAVYRVFFSGVKRTYSPAASNLVDPETYNILGQAMASQYGLAAALFLAGMVLLAFRRKSRPLFLALAIFGGWGLWHVLDMRTVLGYSRFMLYFAPAVLCGAVEVFRLPWRPGVAAVQRGEGVPPLRTEGILPSVSPSSSAAAPLKKTRREKEEVRERDPYGQAALAASSTGPKWPAAAAIALMLAWIGVNVYLSPIHADGSRKAAWGQYRWDETFESMAYLRDQIPRSEWNSYRFDWTEHSYPYRSALRYVTRTYPNDRTLLIGAYYQYWVEFYAPAPSRFDRYWSPMFAKKDLDESATIEQFLQAARKGEIRHVLLQLRDEVVPDPAHMFGFKREKVFENASHALVLYSLPAGEGPGRP
jgi:hypothetical protein